MQVSALTREEKYVLLDNAFEKAASAMSVKYMNSVAGPDFQTYDVALANARAALERCSALLTLIREEGP